MIPEDIQNEKRLCCFVVVYFGRLPAAFPIFLKSCACNPDFDWLIITDDVPDCRWPPNVRRIGSTLEAFRELAEEKLGFPLCLEDPHKLCDLKPAYGFLLEESLQGYRFWGHCDLDTVMGRLKNFLTAELMECYDKLFCLGHMTIYRNTPEINRVFLSEHNGRQLFREVFSKPAPAWFDEEYQDDNNINRMFLSQGYRVYMEDLSLNIWIGSRRFRRIKYVGDSKAADEHGYRLEMYHPDVCYWYHGRLLQLSAAGEKVASREYLYMHLQYRDMSFDGAALAADILRIVPNRFCPAKALPETAWQLLFTPRSAPIDRLRRLLHRLPGMARAVVQSI